MPTDNVLEQPSQQEAQRAARAMVLLLFAETPVHPGAASGKAALDLPLQRSVQTEWPIINDATLRGGLRRYVETRDPADKDACEKQANSLFGDPNNPGRLSTPDAEVLLFPVASAKGMTAWITCKTALEYFARKLCLFRTFLSKAKGAKSEGAQVDELISAVKDLKDGTFATTESKLTWNGRTIILESDSFTEEPETPPVGAEGAPQRPADKIAQWFAGVLPATQYWTDRLKTHFVIVPEGAFTHYVLRKTDIRTRVKIAEGRVDQGPWTEENIPIDTLLYTIVSTVESNGDAVGEFGKVMENQPVLQFGGDQNLGRGMLRVGRLGGN
jgi:CRISPR-associated protein Cmr4